MDKTYKASNRPRFVLLLRPVPTLSSRRRGRERQERIPATCKSKLRTLLLFFVHFIDLSLAVSFFFFFVTFFFYTSPLKVCHHARCSFSVGSTCKVVVFCWCRFSHIGQLEGEGVGGLERAAGGSEARRGQTPSASGVTAQNQTRKVKNKLTTDYSCRRGRGEGVSLIIEGSRRVIKHKAVQFLL